MFIRGWLYSNRCVKGKIKKNICGITNNKSTLHIKLNLSIKFLLILFLIFMHITKNQNTLCNWKSPNIKIIQPNVQICRTKGEISFKEYISYVFICRFGIHRFLIEFKDIYPIVNVCQMRSGVDQNAFGGVTKMCIQIRISFDTRRAFMANIALFPLRINVFYVSFGLMLFALKWNCNIRITRTVYSRRVRTCWCCWCFSTTNHLYIFYGNLKNL